MVDSTNSWWIDSRAINHVYNSLYEFHLRRSLHDREMYSTLVFKVRIVVQAVKDTTLILDDSCL